MRSSRCSALALGSIAACSGGSGSVPRAASGSGSGSSAAVVRANAAGSAAPVAPVAPVGPYRAEPGEFSHGDVQVRVEWPDTPTDARASPGRTPCGTARAPAVAPTVTWGIPDAIVMIDVDHGKPRELAGAAIDASQARVTLSQCALVPRVALASSALVIASETDAPAALSLARIGDARPLAAGSAGSAGAIPIELPIDGHAVAAQLADGALYELTGSATEPAWIAVPPQPYYAITEASGQVVLRDVPVGTFAVAALVPARAGQPARAGRATVTVTANALAEVTVALAPPATPP